MEAYGGRFESVFVVLHPFVSVPDELAWKTTKSYPSDEQILAQGAKCTWGEAAVHTGLRSCARLNQALLTSIRSIGDDLCDFKASEALNGFLESEPVWMPSEGRFEPLLEADFVRAFEAAGYDELVFVPELRFHREGAWLRRMLRFYSQWIGTAFSRCFMGRGRLWPMWFASAGWRVSSRGKRQNTSGSTTRWVARR